MLKQWERLCKKYVVEETQEPIPSPQEVSDLAEASSDSQSDSVELEVSSLVDICYVDADGSEEQGLKFKVICKLHFQRFKKHCIVTKEL